MNGGYCTTLPLPSHSGQQEPERDDDLRDADRRDREDQARRAEEPAQEHELHEDAEHDRRDEAGRGREIDVPALRRVQEQREDRRRLPEVGGREVHDPVGAVDDRDAERDERGEQPADRAAEHRFPR